MNYYDRYLLPYLIDLACGINPVRRQREKVVPLASGRVLEIGIGTGHNISHYDRTRVEKIWGLDPALEMHSLAAKRIAQSGLEVELLSLPAEMIPMPDGYFDTVVTTFTLCSIAEPVKALREMYRVLKPDGQLIFCEHGAAPDDGVRAWQDRLTPIWRRFAGNCHLNRPIPDLLTEAGFRINNLETLYLPGPRLLNYNYWGFASRD